MARSRRPRRRLPCWAWAMPAALVLCAAATWMAKGRVDGALEAEARAGLDTANLRGVVQVDFDWGKGVLRGAGEHREKALGAVAAFVPKDRRYGLTYVVDDDIGASSSTSAPATGASTSAASGAGADGPTSTVAGATTTAPAGGPLDAAATVRASTIALTGKVASDDQRKLVLDAAVAAFKTANVTDQLTVAGPASPATDDAVQRFAAIITAMGPRLATGTASVRGTTIDLTGTVFNAQSVIELQNAIASTQTAEVPITSNLQVAIADVGTLTQNLNALLGRSGINFDSGSAVITPGSAPTLDNAASSILQIPGVRVAINGYTDNLGSATENQVLSQQRADAVKSYLVGKGVPADQLTATGFGPAQPKADNSTEEGRAANRRIEFVVES